MTAVVTLDTIRRHRPEWHAWLDVVACVQRAAADERWDAAVPAAPALGDDAPLLANARISIAGEFVRQILQELLRVAARAGTADMVTLRGIRVGAPDALELMAASIAQRRDDIAAAAVRHGANADAFQAVIALLAVPVLRACRGRWSDGRAQTWVRPFCLICGSWPAVIEVRGIERTRRARCARCGADWHAQLLRCGYCGTADHELLTTLVPEVGAQQGMVEACGRCAGYVKVLPTLQGVSPEAVLLQDLASVDLDVAAISAGYARPEGAGYDFRVSVSDAGEGHH